MNPIINSTLMTVDEKEFLLVDVSSSFNSIGVTTVSGKIPSQSERQPILDIFFIGDEPIISMLQPNRKDKTLNKLITQIGSVNDCDEQIITRFAVACDNYFIFRQNLIKAIQPVIEMLTDGLYVVHVSKMIQSDGAGNFFWNAYTTRHEIIGTAEQNSVIGSDSNFTPCFLIPSANISDYSDVKIKGARDAIKSDKQIGGIAYHISGLFSVLLNGHHSSTACLLEDIDFNCIVIEPLRDVLYESSEKALELNRPPRPIALSCPFVKIPLDAIPETTLETFLLTRRRLKPNNFDLLKSRSSRNLRVMSKRTLPKEVYKKADLLPDCAIMESAQGVSSLSEEQLSALLNGDVSYDGELIISNNYYNSIVTACNYLQFANFNRFIEFALSILSNYNLTATHKYIIDRISNVMDSNIYNYFLDLITNHKDEYPERVSTAESYMTRYQQVLEEEMKEERNRNSVRRSLLKDKEMNEIGLAQMEAFVKRSKGR